VAFFFLVAVGARFLVPFKNFPIEIKMFCFPKLMGLVDVIVHQPQTTHVRIISLVHQAKIQAHR
jgi:hypothetical protein